MSREAVDFFREDGSRVEARRHINPDGSLGGWVATTARVHPSAIVEPGGLVGPESDVGPGQIVRNGEIIAADIRIPAH